MTGDLGPESYDLHDSAIQELEAMVDLEEDAQMTHRGARLSIELNETTLSETIDRVAGDPSMPMTRAEILAKFARYAGRDGAAFLDAPGEFRFPDVSPL